MKKTIIGKKLGMSQIFTADGKMIPVSVVEAGPCVVTQVKTTEKDGYDAVQVGYGAVKANAVTKPEAGHFAKASVEAKKYLKEIRTEAGDALNVGDVLKCSIFAVGDKIDVTGLTRGRGYTGVIQRWNAQRVGSMSHGTGPIHRSVGSMAANSDPSRVFKNKHMAGQYGHEQVTISNLEVVRVDEARNLLFIKGGIPGAKEGLVVVKQTLKVK